MQTQFYVKREVNASIATENNEIRVNEIRNHNDWFELSVIILEQPLIR